MIRLVVFDLGNVITPFDHTVIAPGLHARSRAKGRFTPKDIHDHIFDWDDGYYIQYEEGAITTAEFVGEVCGRFELDLDVEGFRAIWSPIFGLDDGVVGLIRALKGRGVPLFLLSNTNEMHWEYIKKNYAVVRDFDETIVSHEVRLRKPQRAMYEQIFTRAGAGRHRLEGLQPDEVFFTDDWEHAVAGAAAFGIKTHLFKDAAGLRQVLISDGLLPPSRGI